MNLLIIKAVDSRPHLEDFAYHSYLEAKHYGIIQCQYYVIELGMKSTTRESSNFGNHLRVTTTFSDPMNHAQKNPA